MRYCGRDFTPSELDQIRQIIAQRPQASRAELSRRVCQRLGWHKPDGGLKAMSCRVAMLRMEDDGLLTLPPPRNGNGHRRPYRRRTPATDPGPPLAAAVHELGPIDLQLLAHRADSHLWNEYIARYHYLGYRPLPGAQLRYIARARGQVVALLGFGAAAWRVGPRDRWIGWNDEQRKHHLHLIVNNARFLILPWVKSKNLASKVLGLATRRLHHDWSQRYAYRPVLVETFVETHRFSGACYRAANWVHVGTTQGRGKLDRNHTATLPRKAIWLYPLARHFRTSLCS
jgi:hypothetical protein